ncbi:MAG: hypothetical protein IPK75_10215 [Acidobacteria bacterium]|jgi:hypothetical protein|nr:hypothetical protein [Acidobacteriota bacterium]
MKPIFVAIALVAMVLPATSQGNNHSGNPGSPAQYETTPYEAAPMSTLAQQAFDTCPALIARTESAVASGHQQYYYQYDCECMARSIDYNSWDEASATYSGPKMPGSDAYAIIGALASSPTIEDAFSAIDSNVSETGYSAVSACYGK